MGPEGSAELFIARLDEVCRWTGDAAYYGVIWSQNGTWPGTLSTAVAATLLLNPELLDQVNGTASTTFVLVDSHI